jgi:hypothetical protein
MGLAARGGSEGWGRGKGDVVAERAEAVQVALSSAQAFRVGEGCLTEFVVGGRPW